MTTACPEAGKQKCEKKKKVFPVDETPGFRYEVAYVLTGTTCSIYVIYIRGSLPW